MLLVLLTASALAVVVTGPLAKRIGDIVGLGSTAVTVWDIAKWPVLVLVVSLMIALLYYAIAERQAPEVPVGEPRQPARRLLWIAASALFAFYVANFGSYNKTYGALGGVIVFLTWLWITNNVILLGAEVNAELERGRQIQGGLKPADKEPFLEPRDTRKMKNNEVEAAGRGQRFAFPAPLTYGFGAPAQSRVCILRAPAAGSRETPPRCRPMPSSI